MNLYRKCKYIITSLLLVSFLCSPISVLITEATEGYHNSTSSHNCYAYAINEIIFDDAFYFPNSNKPRYQPGDITEDIYNNFDIDSYGYDLGRVKCNTLKDLYALGYTDVVIYNNINDVTDYSEMLANIDFSMKELICFRVGSDDYHFMRYDSSTNAWYNKIEYNDIFKYTENGGIPSNDIPWNGNGVYDSEIIYLAFNKLQINVSQAGTWEGNITVKGGEVDTSGLNYIYCCSYESCCNPNGICECANEAINGGKDVVYEIDVPASTFYNIELSTESNSSFNYKIYSYNMYNGNYQILAQGSGNSTTGSVETVNLTAYDDYNDGSENWQYQAYRYYIRLDFGKVNTSDETVNVTITHNHDYTDHYENNTLLQHKAYCRCGEYKLQRHQLVDGECSLCGELHQHLFSYTWLSNVTHQEVCFCGEEGRIKPHVVESDAFSGGAMYASCIVCGGRVSMSPQIILSVNKLPHTENGSYIRPDGIIVLVDEDIEAYLNGELVFYNSSNNLENE